MLGSFLTIGFLVIFSCCLAVWLGVKLIKIIVKNRELRYILLSVIFLTFIIGGVFYFWEKYKQNKVEQKFCSETQNLSQEQLYQRAMASYFQSYKKDIIFRKSKDGIDNAEKRNNSEYNLFLLKRNILDFPDLNNSLKEQIENPKNTRDPNRKGVNKILIDDLVFNNISHGSVVVLKDYAKIKDNIELNNDELYYPSRNKNSLLLVIGNNKDKNEQVFFPSNCCKIIKKSELSKFKKNISEIKYSEKYLLVSSYSYELNMLINDMKFKPLEEIRFEKKAYPVDDCGRTHFNDYIFLTRNFMLSNPNLG